LSLSSSRRLSFPPPLFLLCCGAFNLLFFQELIRGCRSVIFPFFSARLCNPKPFFPLPVVVVTSLVPFWPLSRMRLTFFLPFPIIKELMERQFLDKLSSSRCGRSFFAEELQPRSPPPPPTRGNSLRSGPSLFPFPPSEDRIPPAAPGRLSDSFARAFIPSPRNVRFFPKIFFSYFLW